MEDEGEDSIEIRPRTELEDGEDSPEDARGSCDGE